MVKKIPTEHEACYCHFKRIIYIATKNMHGFYLFCIYYCKSYFNLQQQLMLIFLLLFAFKFYEELHC